MQLIIIYTEKEMENVPFQDFNVVKMLLKKNHVGNTFCMPQYICGGDL